MITRLLTIPFAAGRLHILVAAALLVGMLAVPIQGVAQDDAGQNGAALQASDAADTGNGDGASATASRFPALDYPATRTVDHVDEYHGTLVADPYRWMEDLNSDELAEWVEAQNEVTFGVLESIPQRGAIVERLTELWNYERFGAPSQQGGRYFYTYNNGLQAQSVIYVQDGLDGEPRLLLDPNTLSDDGTVALSGRAVSPDGGHMAYATSEAGSDWKAWHVRDVATGEDLDDTITWSKFSGAYWSADNSGFYYAAYEPPSDTDAMSGTNRFQKVYFHVLGTPQSGDELVYHRPDDGDMGCYAWATEDGRWQVIGEWKGSAEENALYLRDLDSTSGAIMPLAADWDARYSIIGNTGETFYLRTTLDAPRGRVVAIDASNPAQANWREVIPQRDEVLSSVSLINGVFLLSYMRDASSRIEWLSEDGTREGVIELPGVGSARGFGGDLDDTETFYSFTGFASPTTTYRLDMETMQSEVFRTLDVKVDTDALETSRIFFESRDGTRVPMFVSHLRGIELDGTNPTLLYGYGGFNSSMTPFFSVTFSTWMEMGGVLAVACLRGGGEYGEEWHQAGTGVNKQNVFDDFIAAGEWLIDEGYTSNRKLAIQGGSNGGLLVGAVLNQRPDLFGAAIPQVGVMDMLRFQEFTIGWAWTSDYGSSADPEVFPALLAYSPYHNVRRGISYPPTLITTSDHDDRVVPCHSFKYAARMQAAQLGTNPILLRVETRGGHGAGLPTAKRIAAATDRMAFLAYALEIELPAGFGTSGDGEGADSGAGPTPDSRGE